MLEAARARYPALRINFGIFPCEVRPEYVRRDLVRAVRPFVTNRYLAAGGQSSSDRVLALVRRVHTVADILRATEIILGEDIAVPLDIMFGLPGETADDVCLTRHLRRPRGRNRSQQLKVLRVYGFPKSAIRLCQGFGGQVRNPKAEYEYENEHKKICAKCTEVSAKHSKPRLPRRWQ